MITHASHYFPKEHFEAAVMVCLTSMLVMTTLLLQVSSSLPVTGSPLTFQSYELLAWKIFFSLYETH